MNMHAMNKRRTPAMNMRMTQGVLLSAAMLGPAVTQPGRRQLQQQRQQLAPSLRQLWQQ
jgi:hypothetical protein